MKAWVYTRYGQPEEVLTRQDIPKPNPGDNEVLVKLKAVSLNGSDWEILTAKPAYSRIFGLLRPRIQTLGSDIAGVVEAVGSKVTRFQVGDAVFGDTFETFGGFAEYLCTDENKLLHKPDTLSFADAASLPQGGTIALQGLRHGDKSLKDRKVMINGAGGSAGAFAVQLAKMYGATVTGVDNGGKLDLMRSLGADKVIDYTCEDFAKQKDRYDLTFDMVAHRSLFDHLKVLKPAGKYIMAGGAVPRLFQTLIIGPLVSLFTKKSAKVLGLQQNITDMKHMADLVETGKIRPRLDCSFSFNEVPAALRHLGDRKALGKAWINFDSLE